jgi:cytochrome c-type biogenesis protein
MAFGVDAWSLVLPAFVAGLITFLAPCTLPLVPGYLAFIGGVSLKELDDPTKARAARQRIFLNGVTYVVGFSVIFILLGSLFGLGGASLVRHRLWLSRVGGVVVAFFGLYLLGAHRLKIFQFLESDRRLAFRALTPGHPASSFVFGATFAFGWTPCIGPVLGSVLLLASTSATVASGAMLLAVFSLGLAVPFLIVAAGVGAASTFLREHAKFFAASSAIGGVLLVLLGWSLATDSFTWWLGYAYRLFDFVNYESLLRYL